MLGNVLRVTQAAGILVIRSGGTTVGSSRLGSVKEDERDDERGEERGGERGEERGGERGKSPERGQEESTEEEREEDEEEGGEEEGGEQRAASLDQSASPKSKSELVDGLRTWGATC
eukprot:3941057-Rhodomonas_salina.1